jgi:hypothetical protein
MKRFALLFWLLPSFIAGLSACESPGINPGADVRQNTRSSRIEGNLVVSSSTRGNAILFLYDAARPPPPAGTGRPLTFTTVSSQRIFGNAPNGISGPFSAPFGFPLVNPGRYLIRAFLDVNADFIPWYAVTSDVNAGDVGGGALDANRNLKVIEVVLDENQRPLATTDVGVAISDVARVPVDRPVFEVAGGVASVKITNAPAAIELVLKPIAEGAIAQPAPVFLARLVDDNGDGVPDDANGDGIPDFWPRVVVRKMASGANVLTDENDLDRNGILDAEGFIDYEHLSLPSMMVQPPDGSPDAVVLAAGFDFSALQSLLVDATGRVKLTPTPVNKLKLVIKPQAFDASNPVRPALIRGVPKGTYAITVIQSTGQTWRLPNELSPELATGAGLPTVTSQSFVVEVP